MPDYKNTIKIIGFDLDQTLYPKSPEIDLAIQGYIYKKITAVKKCTEKEAQKLFSDLYKNGSGLSGRKTLLELGVPHAAEVVQEALEHADIAPFLIPNPETLSLLRQLQKRYESLDLITGSNKAQTMKKLGALNIPENIFTNYITSEVASKSEGTAYKQWLALYAHLAPEAFLYIGDRLMSDHVVPHSLGIQTIIVNSIKKDTKISAPQLKLLRDVENYLI